MLRAWLIGAWLLASCAQLSRQPDSLPREPRLRPFSSDGCSRFFDGVPLWKEDLWLSCCVDHDIAYWKGGTAEERLAADERLYSCVLEKAGAAMAKTIYYGVRIGGNAGLPSSWNWGYGWTLNRGYDLLTEEDKAEVALRMAEIPADLMRMPLTSPALLRARASVSGDYCVDESLRQVEHLLGRRVFLQILDDNTKEGGDGWTRRISFQMEGCPELIKVSFQLLKRGACSTPVNEVLARDRIRLREFHFPNPCLPALP